MLNRCKMDEVWRLRTQSWNVGYGARATKLWLTTVYAISRIVSTSHELVRSHRDTVLSLISPRGNSKKKKGSDAEASYRGTWSRGSDISLSIEVQTSNEETPTSSKNVGNVSSLASGRFENTSSLTSRRYWQQHSIS